MNPQWLIAVLRAKLDNIETLAEAAMGNDELRNPGFSDILKVIREPIPTSVFEGEFPLRKLILPETGEDF